ncbi:hypothetical protein P4S72_23900 [Vibrio sp. PP-XX7]
MQTAIQLIDKSIKMANLDASDYARTSVVLGLQANVQAQRQKAQAFTQDFAHYQVVSDVEIACFGAHQGDPGAVLIVGTGSQGASWDGQKFSCLVDGDSSCPIRAPEHDLGSRRCGLHFRPMKGYWHIHH